MLFSKCGHFIRRHAILHAQVLWQNLEPDIQNPEPDITAPPLLELWGVLNHQENIKYLREVKSVDRVNISTTSDSHDSVLADSKETLLANFPHLDNSTRESYLLSIRSDQADTIERRFSVQEFGKVELPYSVELKHNTGAEMYKPLLHKALFAHLSSQPGNSWQTHHNNRSGNPWTSPIVIAFAKFHAQGQLCTLAQVFNKVAVWSRIGTA